MKKLRFVVASVFAALSAVAFAPSASADGTVITRIPVDANYGNFCGETIHAVGEVQFRVTTTTDASGGTHVVAGFNYVHVTATGNVTGARYVWAFSGVDNSFNLANYPDGPLVFAATSTSRLVALGGGTGGYLAHSTFHLTINANGTITVNFDNFSIDCK
jgi:hypothetical protein